MYPKDSPGFLGALRNLGDSLLGTIQERVELFSIEVREEKLRLIQVFFWISAILFTGFMALTFGSLTLIYLYWESSRIALLSGLALFYGLAFASAIVAFRRYLARQPLLHGATLQELKEDRECIRARN